MKRMMGSILCFALLFSLLSAAASGSAALTSGDYRYELTAEGTATITRWLGNETEPELPGTLDGHAVTRIGESAFRDCGSLVKARIPDGVSSIGEMAFYNCAALVDLTLPLSLREIGDLAFAYCSSLKSVMILEGVERIGEFAFGDCPKLSIAAVPASVTQIGPDAFLGMDAELLSGIYGHEGSYAQEYARANGIPFFPFTGDVPPVGPGAESVPVPEELPGPVPEDAPEEAAASPVPAAGVKIIVRFPHADRQGTYMGEMRGGVPNGQGFFTAVNSEGVRWTYDGAWENGAMSGYGTTTWLTDGLEYRGQYRDNQPTQGEWLVDGASVYTGGFKMCAECGENVFHGTGKLTNRLGRVIYEGGFADGLLDETAEGRAARAQALDPQCGRLTGEGYTGFLNAADGGKGKLLKLEGRVGEVILDEGHGRGQFILLNEGKAAEPILVDYRYGTGEERAEAGRALTVWGTVTGLRRETDSRGRELTLPAMDADVIEQSEDRPARGGSELQVTAFKELAGRALKNREFSFALDETVTVIEERVNPLDGTVSFVPVTYTRQMQTKANGRDGVVAFDPIRYAKEDIGGVFTYAVRELPGFEAGMAYDPMVINVTVIVADAGDGTPAVLAFYPDDVTFNNSVAPVAVPQDFEVTVELQGRALQAGEFSFELAEGPVALQTAVNDAAGRVALGPVEFSAADIGATRRFTVRQVPGTQAGVTYDPMVVTFDVTAEFDPGGFGAPMLTVPVPFDTAFNNVFTATGAIDVSWAAREAEVACSVTLEGRALRNGEFSFELSEGGTVLQTKRNGRDGRVVFGLPYTGKDLGMTYNYTVRQVPGREAGMSYDPAAIPVTVTIVSENGQLKPVISYPVGTVFSNRFVQPPAAPVLSSVDVDTTSMTTGETVTWTPRVSGGTEPYRYRYRLFMNGVEAKDIGWTEDAPRTSRLNSAGIFRMEMTVEDAGGRRSEAVMSPEVTVTEPAWSPMELNGSWNVTLVLTDFEKIDPDVQNLTNLPLSIPQTWTIAMRDEASGNVSTSFADLSPGTLTCSDGKVSVSMADARGRGTTTWEGVIGETNGAVSLSGDFLMDSPGEIRYFGTWSAEKNENGSLQAVPDAAGYRTLKVGDKNDDVKKMRDRLYELGYYNKRYDHGNYTQSTADIVAEFQKANGLPATGVATPETQALMFSDRAIPKP